MRSDLCSVVCAELDWITGTLDDARDRVRDVVAGPVGAAPLVQVWAHVVLANALLDQGDYPAARAAARKRLAVAQS